MFEVTKTFYSYVYKSFEVIYSYLKQFSYFVLDLDSCSELLINLTLAGLCLILGLHSSTTSSNTIMTYSNNMVAIVTQLYVNMQYYIQIPQTCSIPYPWKETSYKHNEIFVYLWVPPQWQLQQAQALHWGVWTAHWSQKLDSVFLWGTGLQCLHSHLHCPKLNWPEPRCCVLKKHS